jgi:hypothetical protein
MTDTGKVMGCHKTRAEAAAQIYAINRSEGKIGKSMYMPKEGDMVMAPNEEEVYVGRVVHVMTEGMLGASGSEYSIEATPAEPAILIQLFEIEEGEFKETEYFVGAKTSEVMAMPSLESNVGMGKAYDGCGCPTCKEMNVDCPDCPVCSAKKADMPATCDCPDCQGTCDCGDCIQCSSDKMGKAYDGCGCATCKEMNVSCEDCPVCSKNMAEKGMCCPDTVEKQAPCWDGYVQRGMKPGANGKPVPNCVPAAKALDLWEDSDDVVYETDSISKADGYSPPAGARSAARRAIKFKEDGKANGAGTAVGWTRAGQLARGETISLSTVKRMYSYFSRHEVDKKGKDWGNNANPSNGYIMWLAWGGDAGFAWARSIVKREADKTLFINFGKDVTKSVRLVEVFKSERK